MGRQLRRVPLNFDWPLNKTWGGFINPHYKQCSACNGTGETMALQRLSDLVGLLMLSGEDAMKQRCHPYFENMFRLHRTSNIAPSIEMVELTTGLAGRGPDFMGHDACDRWSATKKIIKAAGLPKKWGTCPLCKGDGIDPASRRKHNRWKETEPPVGDAYQMWETVSEGSPISPPFATPDKLATYLVQHYPDDGTYEQWMAMIYGNGWAPSMMMVNGAVSTGAAASPEAFTV